MDLDIVLALGIPLSLYLLFRRFCTSPSAEFFVIARFNALAIYFMVLEYFFSVTYVFLMSFFFAALLYRVQRISSENFQTTLLLILVMIHALFHDLFMSSADVLYHSTVDFLIHAALALPSLPSIQSTKLRKFLVWSTIFNIVHAILLLDFHRHRDDGENVCDMFFLGEPNFDLEKGCMRYLGGYLSVFTILVATFTISELIRRGDGRATQLSTTKMFFEILPYFTLFNLLYFVMPVLEVVEFYEKIKYDQLYYMLPFFSTTFSLFKFGN